MAEQKNNGFLGKGWTFPPSFDINTACVEMTEAEDDIKKSLEILLSTVTGERVMQPKYGCDLTEMVFEPLDTTLKTFIIDKIKTAIALYESRINVIKIELVSEQINGEYAFINLTYDIRSTNSRNNIVYPYYIGEATENR